MAQFRSIRERMYMSPITSMSPGRNVTTVGRWSRLAMIGGSLGLAITGCEDPPTPPMPAPTASSSATVSALSASVATKPPPPPAPRSLTPPSEEEIAKLDVETACVQICVRQVFCTSAPDAGDAGDAGDTGDAGKEGDAAKLSAHQARCGKSCRRTTPPKEVQAQYLDQARRCLHATDCAMFAGCAFGTQTVHR